MHKKMVLLVLFFVLFIPHTVHGDSIQRYCVDNETLVEVEESTITIDGKTEEVEINKTIKCEYGCVEGDIDGVARCETSGFAREVAFIIFVVILIYIIFRLSR